MKTVTSLCAYVALCAPLVLTHSTVRADEDPIDILKKVDATAKAVTAVRYESEFEGLGDSAAQTPHVKAKIVSMPKGSGPRLFRAEVEYKMPGSDKTNKVTVGTNGDEYYVIDYAAKKAYVDIDPSVLGSAGRAAQMAAVPEYGHSSPFSDEINGKKQELLGTCSINGEEGWEIHVVYANDAQEATWCFSKTSYLPRKRVDTIKALTGGTRSSQRTITSLEQPKDLSADVFNPQIPDGFEKIDDFYPD